jgi:hypothetical protein
MKRRVQSQRMLISVIARKCKRQAEKPSKKVAMTIEYQCLQFDAVIPRRGAMEYIMLHEKSFEQESGIEKFAT